MRLDQRGKIVERAAAEEAAWTGCGDAGDFRIDDFEVDRARQRDRLVEPRLDRSSVGRTMGGLARSSPSRRLRRRVHDERPNRTAGTVCCVAWTDQGSPNSLLPSNSWIGCAGITVEIACL